MSSASSSDTILIFSVPVNHGFELFGSSIDWLNSTNDEMYWTEDEKYCSFLFLFLSLQENDQVPGEYYLIIVDLNKYTRAPGTSVSTIDGWYLHNMC